jgi:hypothetical protein
VRIIYYQVRWRMNNDTIRKFNPDMEDIYILDGKRLVTADYNYGNIICFDFYTGDFVDNWESGYFESKRIQLVGRIIRPLWDEFELKLTKVRSKIR